MKRTKQARTKTKQAKPKHIVKKVTKSAVKKTRPQVKVTIERKIFGKAPEKHEFYLQDGRKIETVYELVDELETMSDEMFKEFVNEADNHFANWIEHVFGEKSLADELRHVQDRIEAQRAILKHLVRELIKTK